MIWDETLHPEVHTFINKHRKWIDWLNAVFIEIFPQLATLYDAVKLPKYYFGIWAAMVINLSFPCFEHRDVNDFRSGVCTIFITSDAHGFIGGALVLDEIKVRVEVQPGDLVFFQSFNLAHFVEDFVGERISCVFLTHYIFFAAKKNTVEELTHLYEENEEWKNLTKAQLMTFKDKLRKRRALSKRASKNNKRK